MKNLKIMNLTGLAQSHLWVSSCPWGQGFQMADWQHRCGTPHFLYGPHPSCNPACFDAPAHSRTSTQTGMCLHTQAKLGVQRPGPGVKVGKLVSVSMSGLSVAVAELGLDLVSLVIPQSALLIQGQVWMWRRAGRWRLWCL